MKPSLDQLDATFTTYQKERKVPSWLGEIQDQAWRRVQRAGLPGNKDEHWKYTSLFDLSRSSFTAAVTPTQDISATADIYDPASCYKLEFINGRLTAKTINNLPPQLELRRHHLSQRFPNYLSREVACPSVFRDINLAFASELIELVVKPNTRIDKPIYFKSITAGDHTLLAPRVFINIGRGANARVVEHLCGSAENALSARQISLDMSANSTFQHITIQNEHPTNTCIGNTDVTLQKDARYYSTYLDLGAKLARHDLSVGLHGAGSQCFLHGLFTPGSGQHFDHHTLVQHHVVQTHSEQTYRGIAAGGGHGVFNGKVLVQKQAQKTSALQNNKNLLLSERSHIDTKPELEIYADDVKCSHGATVGQIDETALFYLRSRGINEREARILLVQGFARKTYQHIACDQLLNFVDTVVQDHLQHLVDETTERTS